MEERRALNELMIKRIVKETISETLNQIGLDVRDDKSIEKTRMDIQDFRAVTGGIRKVKALAFIEIVKMALHAIIIWVAAYVIMKNHG